MACERRAQRPFYATIADSRRTLRADRGIVCTMPRLELFSFRYRDPLTGKWVKARCVAERHEISARYAEWQMVGRPGICRIV